MQKLINWLETSFAPKMNKIAHNIWVVTIKDSVMQVLPFILLGSLFCVGTVLESFITLPFSFWTPFGWTMGMISVLVAFLIPFNFCEKKRLRKQRLISGATGLILFFISITPEIVAEGEPGFGSSAFGAGGVFQGITNAIGIYYTKFLFDRLEEGASFSSTIGIVIFGGFLLVQVAGVNLYAIVTNFFMPLQSILNTWYGFILSGFIYCFIYSMGISSWVLTPVTEPVKLSSIAANLAMVTAGTASVASMNMYTETLMYTCYMWIGGIACTFPLVIMLAFSKSKQLKSLGRACLGPAIFNINEPVVFGCIAWNPIMMLPMWIIGIVIPAFTWFGCKVLQFAPIPRIQFELWYCPYPISTWIASQGSLTAIIWVILTFLLAALIWFPFFKAYEKQCIEEEANNG